MNTEFEMLLGGSNRSSSSSSTDTAGESGSGSLVDRVEAEKRAKIEELLAPYRAKRTELQTKRDEFATALVGLDKDLAELDAAITQVEESVGLTPSAGKKKKPKDGKAKKSSSSASSSAASSKPPVTEDWVIQKLRDYPKPLSELATFAKEDGFKPASVKPLVNKLRDANVLRLNDQEK